MCEGREKEKRSRETKEESLFVTLGRVGWGRGWNEALVGREYVGRCV